MKQIIALVEGPTEETFIGEVLAPHLAVLQIYIKASIIDPNRRLSIPHQKGGTKRYEPIQKDLRRFLKSPQFDLVTTMIDFYARPSNSPKPAKEPANISCHEKVALYEKAFADDINHPKFLPYLSLHEFEAILFANPNAIADTLPDGEKHKKALQAIRAEFNSPEEINENWETKPSRRILNLFPGYEKILYGSLISLEIGLEHIRAECSHFNEWLQKLEALSEGNQ
jgi:hypothetical protein